MTKKVQQRLAELRAVDDLSQISHLPPPRLHQLDHEREGQFAVTVKEPFRLIFRPAHDPVPKDANGGVDLNRITAIEIIEVTNYHG